MTAISLPASLTAQFSSLENRLWRNDATLCAGGALCSLLISFGLEFVSDRLWDTPHWLRMLFALGGWAALAAFAWRYGRRWVWGQRSVRGLAVIVQKRYRRLGDRLLGIVELADPAARPSNYSPELCRAAIAQVAGEAASFDFDEAADHRLSVRYGIATLILICIVAQCFVARPAGVNAFYRWLWPMADIGRYTFVTLEGLPDQLVVPMGEPFDISVGLAASSFWHPGTASSHFQGLPAMVAPISGGTATFHLPGQTEKRVLYLSVGDVRRAMRIDPEVRPDLRQVNAHLVLPSYLEYPALDERIDGGALSFLPGTVATFTGEAVRNLGAATLAGEKPAALEIDGARFKTAPLLLELERDVTFTWRDSLGLAGPTPFSIHVTPRDDEPPDIEVHGLEAAIAILPEETVPIDLAATDDYGVRRVSFAWQTGSANPMEGPGPVHEITVADGKPQAVTLGGHYDFSPVVLNIPEDTTILAHGLAVDYYPDRAPSSSPLYRIHVLSRESHARLVHDQFEKLLAQLEDLTRREESILQSGKAVRSQSAEQLASDNSAQKLAEEATEQRETASQLKKLAAQVADTFAEALRNPSISPDTLKDWAHHAAEMSQIASEAMPAAAKTLSAAGGDAAQRPPELDQALAQERAILDAMREMQKKANDSLETLMAQTLAARLKRAADTESGIASNFRKLLPDTIGMTTEQLPPEAVQAVQSMTTGNATVTREAGLLQQEISRLFDRTNLTRYGDVAHSMDNMKTVDALTALGNLVQKNVSVQSIQTAEYWSKQFEQWADRLGQKDNSQAPPSAGGGQPDAAQMQALLALLALMRLREEQNQLRDQTAALEGQKGTSADYTAGAEGAATRQGAMRDQVGAMQQDPSFPVPARQLAPIGNAMGDAAELLAKPETGQPTTNAQTDALNLLDEVISQQAKESGQDAASLMAMMGAGMGMTTGKGNTSGGTTDKANVPMAGSREGQAPDARRVIQAGGVDNSSVPGEYRDAIQNFQHAIEQSQ